MKEFDSAARLGLTNEDILKQVTHLLDHANGDLRKTLRKEMLVTLLRMGDAALDTLDLKILNRTLRELRYAFKTFYSYRDRQKVSFFGSARTSPDDPNYDLARAFGRRLVKHGFMVITGGGDGIMGAAQEGAGRANSFLLIQPGASILFNQQDLSSSVWTLQDITVIFTWLIRAHLAAGNTATATRLANDLEKRGHRESLPSYYMAALDAHRGNIDRAFAELDRALAERTGAMVWLTVDPGLDPLRKDARFAKLVARR